MFSPSAPALKIVFEISIVPPDCRRYVVDATTGSMLQVAAERAVSNCTPAGVVGDAAAASPAELPLISAVYDRHDP